MRAVVLLVAALTTGAVPVAAQALVRTTADGHAAFDRGTGLVHFRRPPGTPAADTLVLRAAPAANAETVALFLGEPAGEGGWRYVLAAREPLVPNLLEYDYEIAGLPTDSAATVDGRRWVRVLVGARDASGGGLRRAWAAVDTTRVGTIAWAEFLAERDGVFALAPARAVFAATPDGTPVASPFRGTFEADDHWMEILERRGTWLRVRFLQPAGTCGDDPPPDQVRRTLWVRYLDARGRPAVWYYTRGC